MCVCVWLAPSARASRSPDEAWRALLAARRPPRPIGDGGEVGPLPVPLAGPVTRKPPWMYARAGFWPNLSSPLVLPLHAACTLQMVGAAEARWNAGWEAPGFGQSFNAASGRMKTEAFVMATQLRQPPTAPPPLSKMLAGREVARTFESVGHDRRLTQVSASTADELTAAIGDSTVDKIVLAEGTYELSSDMCYTPPPSIGWRSASAALCIGRALIIEAEVAPDEVVPDGDWHRKDEHRP